MAAVLVAFAMSCCSPFQASRRDAPLLVMSWNVLSLFDAVEDGNEYADFSIERGLWGEARYLSRLELVSKVILATRVASGGAKPGPDIVCLVEIEKESVLADLANGPLAAAAYRYRSFAKAEGSPIGVGILSRVPITEARAFGLSTGKRSERPILEARFEVAGKPLVAFLCHWKSKLEGAEATEATRRESAALLARLFSAAGPDQSAFACGDFNENPDEYARVGRRYATAFMPVEKAGSTSGAILLGDREAVLAAAPPLQVLFSPWAGADGYSYVHKGVEERIDGFLLGAGLVDGKGLEYRSFAVFDGAGIVDSAGRPIPWSNASASGWSDHLPILLELAELGE
jgi:endonuclease/exonuclease/phosphatase family metal-dependent hydrolase